MRTIYLASGAGEMYCGSCLQSNTLVAALCRLGEEAVLVPAYTPLRTDEEDMSGDRLVFGGINVYLQEKSALFRHTPWFLDRFFDHPGLLRWLGRRSASRRPESLGALTVSMLQGEAGRQRKELDKLVHWLRREIRPEVVHLSNVLLVGMARWLREALGVPVVCTLSGEDIFLERLPEPHSTQARDALHQRVGDLAALIAPNGYYAEFMADYLAVSRERITVIPPGLNLDGYASAQRKFSRSADAVRLGYLARVCPDKGLHLLADALTLLARVDGLPPVQVSAAGYLGPSERPYLAGIEARLQREGLADRFRYVGELTRPEKIAFLQSLDVMCLPTVYRESKGLPVLEAWACGVPVVVPAHGVFPELIADTGGGLLAKPHDAASLADRLAQLIRDPALASACGRRAQESVHARYHAEAMARRTRELYRAVVG